MAFSDFLLCEGIEPRKPLGKITKKKVTKNRGMVNQKTLDQIEFTTTDGNNVKVQFQVTDDGDSITVGDVVFYVNDTLDDRGGRKDGSVDPEIFGGVLWVVDVYSDRMGLDKLTFSAWSGEGDTKIVRGLDLEKPRAEALDKLQSYRVEVRDYKARVIPPTQRRIELAKKLGREPTVVYDVHVGKLQGILGEIANDVEDRNVAAIVPFEEEVYLSRDTGDGGGGMFDFQETTKLDDLIPGAMELLQTLKKYNVARMSHSEGGAAVTRNRRQDLYKRLMDKFFSDKWSMAQNRDTFELTRKGELKAAGGMGESVSLVERKSLEEKRVYIQSWTEEAMSGLRSGNFFVCDNLKMPFGRFFGAKVIGKYDRERGIRNTYYIGTVDGDMGGSATGRADVEGNEGTVWVKSYGVYDALESILRGIDGFQEHISRIEGFDAEGVIFAFSEGEKKVLYHELSHVYDLMMRGTRGVSGTEHRWSTRPEEIEAELNALYNALLADDTLTLKDFEERLTPDSYGIGAADGKYDTMVGPLFGWARNHPEKVKISAQKILRRWVDMRQMVMNKLGRKVESRKFSDLMNEMPAWSDQDKAIASGIGKTHRMDIDARYKKKWKKIEDWRDGDYQYRVYASDSGKSLNLHVMYEYHEIAVFNWYREKRFWQTISAAVNINHQGKGIGLKVYTHMIDKYMHTLSSDNTLTGETGKGSFDLWVKLGKIYLYKYIYNENNNKLTPVDGFTRDMMQYDNEHFVVSTEDILE